jgi:hypothetical protein
MNEHEQKRLLKSVRESAALSEQAAYARIDDNDAFLDAKTTPVSPSAVGDGALSRPFVADPLSGSSLGRGNDPARSGGPNMPPITPGSEVPMPAQTTGSNKPGSSIRQLPSATQQAPGVFSQQNTVPSDAKPTAFDSSGIATLDEKFVTAGSTLMKSGQRNSAVAVESNDDEKGSQ